MLQIQLFFLCCHSLILLNVNNLFLGGRIIENNITTIDNTIITNILYNSFRQWKEDEKRDDLL